MRELLAVPSKLLHCQRFAPSFKDHVKYCPMYLNLKLPLSLPLVLATLVAGSVLAQESLKGQPQRTWTSSTGQKVQATLQWIKGESVGLQRADGQSFTVPLSRLSTEDQQYVSELEVKQSPPAGTEASEDSEASVPGEPQSEDTPTIEDRFQQSLNALAEPSMIRVIYVGGSTIQLAPFLQIDMAEETENLIWRLASKQPAIFVAEGTDAHQGERLVVKVLPRIPAETANKAEFNGLVQVLQGANFTDIQGTGIQALDDAQSQFQFYLTGTSADGTQQHFYTYIVHLDDRFITFQSNAATNERASELIQLGPTAQLLVKPETGNVPDLVRRDLEAAIKKIQRLLASAPPERILEEIMRTELQRELKRDRKEWQNAIDEFEQELRGQLKHALSQIDFSKAMFDEQAREVTFPVEPRPITFENERGRWIIRN